MPFIEEMAKPEYEHQNSTKQCLEAYFFVIEFKNAAQAPELDLESICQRPNSLDLNVLDIGIFLMPYCPYLVLTSKH